MLERTLETISNWPAPTNIAEIEVPTTVLSVSLGKFSEVREATRRMANNKAPGLDLMMALILKEVETRLYSGCQDFAMPFGKQRRFRYAGEMTSTWKYQRRGI